MRYRPILKSREAELDALAALTSVRANKIIPLIEVMRPGQQRKKPPPKSAQVAEAADHIMQVWQHAPIAVDVVPCGMGYTLPTGVHALVDIVDQLLVRGVAGVVPVARLQGPVPRAAERDAASRTGNGILLRLSESEVTGITADGGVLLGSRIDQWLADVGSTPSDVDLVLDLEVVPLNSKPSLLAAGLLPTLAMIPARSGWRSVTLAAGAFPERPDLLPQMKSSSGRRHTVADELVPRADWMVWANLPAAERARLHFGDYAVGTPGPPAEGGFPFHPTLRWPQATDWRITRWFREKGESMAGFSHVCADVLAAGGATAGHCAGCDEVVAIAGGASGKGRPATMWRRIATAHHLALVADAV